MPLTTEYFGCTITNLGPLTTTYTAPTECATATENIHFVNAKTPFVPAAWGYPSCVPGDYGKCIPSGDAYDKLAKEHASTLQQDFLPYYSPGLVCPKGWTTAGEYAKDKGPPTEGMMLTTRPSNTITQPLLLALTKIWTTVLEDSETLVFCCPSGYTGDIFLSCHSVMGPLTEFSYTEGCIHTWPGKSYTDLTATFDGAESPYLSKMRNTAEPGTAHWTQSALRSNEEANIAVATKVPAVALVHKASDLDKPKESGESEKNAAAAPLSARGMMPMITVVVSILAGAGILAPW